jgi:hypothetical protein
MLCISNAQLELAATVIRIYFMIDCELQAPEENIN